MNEVEALSYEQAVQQLQLAVESLETGGTSLDEAVALFERGMHLVALCSRHLDQTELRVVEIETALDAALERDDLRDGPLGQD